jgi:dolichol kinase
MTTIVTCDDPLKQNLLACTAVIIYAGVVLGVCGFGINSRFLTANVSRKIIHVAAGLWVLFWPLFTLEHWTWRFNILVPAVYSFRLLIKGVFIQNPNDPDVKRLSRSGKPMELCNGPLLFTLVMCICGIYLFRTDAGIYVMGCLGLGDGLAPLAGAYVPFGHYRTFPFGPKNYKTLSGSILFFASSVFGIILLGSVVMGVEMADIDWKTTILVSLIGAIVEAATGPWDNLSIPLAAFASFQYFSAQS